MGGTAVAILVWLVADTLLEPTRPPGEQGVGARDPGDAPVGEQDAEAAAVDPAVVGDDSQIAGALGVQGADQNLGHAAEAEAADGERGAVGDVGDRVGAGDV